MFPETKVELATPSPEFLNFLVRPLLVYRELLSGISLSISSVSSDPSPHFS